MNQLNDFTRLIIITRSVQTRIIVANMVYQEHGQVLQNNINGTNMLVRFKKAFKAISFQHKFDRSIINHEVINVHVFRNPRM